ncbi:DUF1905 domain-containing protein [Cryobacterium breve]|uniref:DUF1905 domain-containing protein n=1 Tax=Cryobacterium breve TaxID=1259258 RepID=A0ABY7NDM8_9MICO|nr:DUF1905 domain-containing protein [Cryobacterium breve]WBM79649.1 DUF1905 domain-containing protein [Cryobacterium breve]
MATRTSGPTGPRFTFTAALWEYEGKGAWIFVSVPVDESEVIRKLTAGQRNAFGSVRVLARIDDSRWPTSLFYSSASGQFLLPVKKSIRVAEGLEIGSTARVEIALVL